jgi:hypothetical protein
VDVQLLRISQIHKSLSTGNRFKVLTVTLNLILTMNGCGMGNSKYALIYGKIYRRERNIYKYICDDNDIDRWQAWCDEMGAEKGTVEDMMSIGEDEIADDDNCIGELVVDEPEVETGLAVVEESE